jgi:DNA polymerase-4
MCSIAWVSASLAFLHPLPVERLWGVGPVTAGKLYARGLVTVAQVAALSEDSLVALLGVGSGRHLHALAHNRDPRPVVVGRRRRSISSQHAIGTSATPKSPAELDEVVVSLVERVTRRMQRAGRVGRTVVLRRRFDDDFTRVTRSHSLSTRRRTPRPLLQVARELLTTTSPIVAERGCTLVGIAVGNLDDTHVMQLELPRRGGRATVGLSALSARHMGRAKRS